MAAIVAALTMKPQSSRLAKLTKFLGGSAIYAGGVGLQFVTIVLLARLLGPTEFGKYSIYAAITLVAIEVLAVGSGDVMIKNVALRPRRFSALYGHSLLVGLVVLIPATAAVLLAIVGYELSAAPWLLLAMVAAVEIASGRVMVLGEQAFIAHKQAARANLLRLGVNGARTAAAAIAFLSAPGLDLFAWIAVQALASALAAVAVLIAIRALLGPPRFVLLGGRIAGGLPFAGTQIVRMTQMQVDRLLIGLVASPYVVGVYAAASRVISLGTLPMVTLLRMTYPHFFVHGARGMRAVLPFGMKVLGGLMAVAAVTVACFYFAAPLLPLLLGEEYTDAVPAAQLLAPICFAYAFQYAGGDMLSGGGHQNLRFISTVLNLACIAAGILIFGREGGPIAVVVAVLAGNALGAAMTWMFVLVTALREPNPPAASSSR